MSFPAYKSLAQSLEKLKGSGKNQGGLCHLPEGKKYYAYLIKSSTGDYRSVREIQKHLYQQLFLDFEEIQNLVQKDPDIFTKAAQLPQTASSSSGTNAGLFKPGYDRRFSQTDGQRL